MVLQKYLSTNTKKKIHVKSCQHSEVPNISSICLQILSNVSMNIPNSEIQYNYLIGSAIIRKGLQVIRVFELGLFSVLSLIGTWSNF